MGPLSGIRIIEFASIGPGPHCAMMLSDLGAEVIRIVRPGTDQSDSRVVNRGRHVLEIDIRTVSGRNLCLSAAEKADIIIEGMRPGVMERLGLGPEPMLACNPRLIYARMTGWGQEGPLAGTAGHDINYIALTGALSAMGSPESPPRPPLNLVGDFGGGSMLLAFGIAAALFEREKSGQGQAIDAAIIDGVASMMTLFAGLVPLGAISLERDRNLLNGSAPFYRCYVCADGQEIAIGAIEPSFYELLLDLIDAPPDLREKQYDHHNWCERSQLLETIFASRTRDDWSTLLEGSDACYAPVLSMEEAPAHPQMLARNVFEKRGGRVHAQPVPRFSRTPGRVQKSGDGCAVLRAWGVLPDLQGT